MGRKFIILASLAVVATLVIQYQTIVRLSRANTKYRSNTETLLGQVESYRTRDSLNACTVGALQLRVSEFEKYRSEDAALIKTLQTRNRDLSATTKMQSETITRLRGEVRDSIVYMPGDTSVIILRCVDIDEPWFSLHGCTAGGVFEGEYVSRDSVVLVETVKYKRFLGFLWKTGKVKDRKIDVVSRNPHTEIRGVEHIIFRD